MRPRPDPIAGPSTWEADTALGPREVGSRLAQGPFAKLGKGRWSVPAVAYMSLEPRGEVVLYASEGQWMAEKAQARATVSVDDTEEEMFGQRRGLRAQRKGRAA